MTFERGKIKFFLPERCFGFIICEDGSEVWFSEKELQSGFRADRGTLVEFYTDRKGEKPVAKCVRAIGAQELSGVLTRFQGRVIFFDQQKWGKIEYKDEFDQLRSIFFHIVDVRPAHDGIRYDPYPECLVEFDRGERNGKELATNIDVTEWPEVEATFEEIFLSLAEDEPETKPVPSVEPVPIVEQQSVLLKPENKNKTLLELIQQRK